MSESHSHRSSGSAGVPRYHTQGADRRTVLKRRKVTDRRKRKARARQAPGMQKKIFHDNQFIFRERETGDRAFIVESGTVEIVKRTAGEEVVIGTVGKGGMFGEMALIDNSPRMASARSVGPVKVVIVSRQSITRKLDAMDPFSRGLLGILSDHVRRLAANVEVNPS